ncbi:MAG: RHS repeat-associated core domain-containing protein, partial [Candidatus Nitrotoga sp. SPKER]
SRSANGLNQHTIINSNAITHDTNGNLQSDGLWAYSHDLDNRLAGAVRNNPASSVSLGYDPAGRLNHTDIDGTVTDLLYDGTDLIAEYDGAGNLTTRHIHGPGVDEPLVSISGTTKTWRYADHLGSVIAEADVAGNALAIRSYGPFGENGATVPNRFGYTGQQYIAGLGLYYYKARWYSPTMNRFLETDPIGYGDGVNWYAYVGNSPVNGRDPSGERGWQSVVGAIIGYIGGGLGSAGYQYATTGSVNWTSANTAASWGAAAGAVAPIVATTYTGAAIVGALSNATQYLSSTDNFSTKNFITTIAAGGLGGFVGGPFNITRNIFLSSPTAAQVINANVTANVVGSAIMGGGISSSNDGTGAVGNGANVSKK